MCTLIMHNSMVTIWISAAYKLTCVPSQEDVVSERCGRLWPRFVRDLIVYMRISGHTMAFCSSAAFRQVSTSVHL